MTLQEKQRKVKILQAMMIVNYLKARHAKTIAETLTVVWEGVAILHEMRNVSSQRIPKEGLAIISEKRPEIIIRK